MQGKYPTPFTVAVLVALACASGTIGAQEPVIVEASIPYADPQEIQRKVRDECTELNRQLAQYIQEYARGKGVTVQFGDTGSDQGPELRVEITQAISQGNAWMGHAKSSSARGGLYRDGDLVARFRATRNSMGGAFAGYKGSCSVLGRTMRALGRDIGEWLANPVDAADLGDR